MKQKFDEEDLDLIISYILILGVLASLALETIGIMRYYSVDGTLTINLQPNSAFRGTPLSFLGSIIHGMLVGVWTPFEILGLGVFLLTITPYMRVVAAVVYFSLTKNTKYIFITLFVLTILTASLLIH
jgi:uncharacterized membrane protein